MVGRRHGQGQDHPLPAHVRPLRAPAGQHEAAPRQDEAVDAYGEREREFADWSHIEVVVLGADSEQAIRVTHPIYFETDFSLEKYAKLAWLGPELAAS